MTSDSINDLLDTTEVAEMIRVSPGTLRYWRLIDEGPPYMKVGRRKVLYRRSEVEDWLAGGARLVGGARPASAPRGAGA